MELQQVMIDSRTYDFETVIHVRQGEERFAVQVGFGDVEGVEGWGVVVEDAEEVVVVAQEIGRREGRGGLEDVSGGLHGAKVGYRAEQGVV